MKRLFQSGNRTRDPEGPLAYTLSKPPSLVVGIGIGGILMDDREGGMGEE